MVVVYVVEDVVCVYGCELAIVIVVQRRDGWQRIAVEVWYRSAIAIIDIFGPRYNLGPWHVWFSFVFVVCVELVFPPSRA